MDNVEERERPRLAKLPSPGVIVPLDGITKIGDNQESKPSASSSLGDVPDVQADTHEEQLAYHDLQRHQTTSNGSSLQGPSHDTLLDRDVKRILEDGSIRYVHQDWYVARAAFDSSSLTSSSLRSWLKASARTRCDLCNYPYKYKKIYSQDMPQELAICDVLWPLLGQFIHWTAFVGRLVLVTTLWLAIIPALVYWCWQIGFLMGDYVCVHSIHLESNLTHIGSSLRISGKLQYLELYTIQLHNLTENIPTSPMPSTQFSSTLSPADLTPTLLSLLPSNAPSDPLYQATSVFDTSSTKDTLLSTTTQAAALHPSSSIIASAFSDIASVMQYHNFKSKRRSPFRPAANLEGHPLSENITIPQHLSIFLAGKPLFNHQSPIWVDCIRLLFMVLARFGAWMSSALLAFLVIPYDIYSHCLKGTDSTNSNWKEFKQLTEQLANPIMTGQLIAVSLVISYVGIWFVREWVLANAEDGAFGQGRRGRANIEVIPPEQNNVAGIPGAFPEQPQLDLPADDILDEDLDFAFEEPTTPPLNIISLEEQEELMHEVQKKRTETAEEERKRHAQIEEWQVEKTTQIVEEWKDQKLKEIRSRLGDAVTPLSVRPEDGAVPRVDGLEDVPIPDDPRIETDYSPPVERVEHIEHTGTVPAEPPVHLRPTISLVDESTASESPSSSAPTAPPSFGPTVTGNSSPSQDPDRWSSRFFPRTPVNERSSSSCPEPSGSSKRAESGFWSEFRSRSSSRNASESDLGAFAKATALPTGPPSVFATLVPPTPPSSGQQLPFSIRDFRVAPLDAETSTSRPNQPVNKRSGLVLRSSSTGVLGQDALLRGYSAHPSVDAGDPGASFSIGIAASSWGEEQRNLARLPNKHQGLQRAHSEGLSNALIEAQGSNQNGELTTSHPSPQTARSVITTKRHPSSQPYNSTMKIQSQMSGSRVAPGLNVNAPVFQPRYAAFPPVSIPTSNTRVEPARGSPDSSLAAATQHTHVRGTVFPHEPNMSAIKPLVDPPLVTERQGVAFGQPNAPAWGFNPALSYSLPQKTDGIAPPFTQAIIPSNTSGRPKHVQSMSMGMGFKSAPSFVSPEENQRQRGRSLTTGASSLSTDSQGRNFGHITSVNAQQRSNSLSGSVTTTSINKSDVNHLLQPTRDIGSVPADDAKSKLKVQGTLWYGLPDSQRGFEPKHLLLEDEKTKQPQPTASKGRGKKRKRTPDPQRTTKKQADTSASSHNGRSLAQKPILLTTQPVQSVVLESDGTPNATAIQKAVLGKASSSQIVTIDRAKPPGPISLPEQILHSDEIGTFPKRPALASAASPTLLESPSSVALYQAPEEVQARSNPSGGQIQDETYFRPFSNLANGIIPVNDQPLMHNNQPIADAPAEPLLVGVAAERVDIEPDDEPDLQPPPAMEEQAADVVALDEFGQVLEMVGIRGAWQSVVQNATLVIVIFVLTLGSGVFTPYILGKTTSLLLVDSSSIVRQLFLDTTGLNAPNMSHRSSLKRFSVVGQDLALLFGDVLCFSIDALYENNPTPAPEAPPRNLLLQIWPLIRPTTIISWIITSSIRLLVRWRDYACSAMNPPASSAMAIYSGMNQVVCALPLGQLRKAAYGDDAISHILFFVARLTATDRIASVTAGYLLILMGYALRAKLHSGSHASLPLTLIKASTLCAVYMHISTLVNSFVHTLSHSVDTKGQYGLRATTDFTNGHRHWILGNATITLVLETSRALKHLLRPGAIHHIEPLVNPRAPSIRSMVHKSIIWHIKHAAFTLLSAITLLWIILGLPIDLNRILTPTFFPMQLDLRNSSFKTPFDLVSLHLCIPAVLRFLKIKKLVKKTTKAFLLQTSRFLRLEYVFFDHPVPSSGIFEGTFWRVPVAEGAIVLAGQPRAIRTDSAGNGITQEDRDRIDMQLVASERARRNPTQDYHVVFYPDYLEIRIAAFVAACWLGLFATYWITITLPVLSGRLLFKSLGIVGVFDGYAWMLSLFILWMGTFGKYLVDREHRKWSKFFENAEESSFPLDKFLIRILVVISRLLLSVILLAGLAPLSIGLLFEVYLVLPLSYHFYPGTTPTIRIAEAWTAGCIILAIGIQGLQFGEAAQLPHFLHMINRDGWVRLKVRVLIKEALPPCIAIMVMAVTPFVLQYIIPGGDNEPGHSILGFLQTAWDYWIETIRDRNYLEYEMIENLDGNGSPDSNDQDSFITD
ncbi:hypothetical protein FRC17_003193 [Serendipita sp. 399]|nr:hypothetical protein FRC17_003193 [Serendipita sp. 399]